MSEYLNFLPEGNAQLRTERPYLNLSKLTEGEHRFRIVERPIGGWIDWIDNKPMRSRPQHKPLPHDPLKPVRSFWAMHVWDYARGALYVMEITQNGIKKALEDYASNEDWGDFTKYDIVIKKEGTGKETNYNVMAIPPKPLAKKIVEALAITKVNLEALYEGKDPWGNADVESTKNELTELQLATLSALISLVKDQSYLADLERKFNCLSLENIDIKNYERLISILELKVSKGENVLTA